MTTRTASRAYGEHAEAIRATLQNFEAQFDAVIIDARSAHWGHVGDLCEIERKATELREQLESMFAAHRVAA